MATYITEQCINCGVCEPVCPNHAITPTEYFYLIDPQLCTECVGFHGEEQCQSVCPVLCCLPDPDFREGETSLIQRALKLHPNDAALRARHDSGAYPSRFRKG